MVNVYIHKKNYDIIKIVHKAYFVNGAKEHTNEKYSMKNIQ